MPDRSPTADAEDLRVDAQRAPERTPARLPWAMPRGRDLLAGIAVISVCVAILVVFTTHAPPAPRASAAQPLVLPGAPGRAAIAPPEWSDVPVATRPSELGPALAKPVSDALAAAHDKLARCLAVDRRRRAGAEPAPAVAGPPAGPAEVVLRLAPRSGAVHIEAIEVRSPGSSPELVDCTRRVLDGDAIPAPRAVPGRRYRLAVVLE